jgi:hypothetical protein
LNQSLYNLSNELLVLTIDFDFDFNPLL